MCLHSGEQQTVAFDPGVNTVPQITHGIGA
jgi:hypothetical protein